MDTSQTPEQATVSLPRTPVLRRSERVHQAPPKVILIHPQQKR